LSITFLPRSLSAVFDVFKDFISKVILPCLPSSRPRDRKAALTAECESREAKSAWSASCSLAMEVSIEELIDCNQINEVLQAMLLEISCILAPRILAVEQGFKVHLFAHTALP